MQRLANLKNSACERSFLDWQRAGYLMAALAVSATALKAFG
jgi:uncharacterized membrane protein YidH (DUF202 family)